MDKEINGPDSLPGLCALVEDVPDPASVAILALEAAGELPPVARRGFQRAVCGRYWQLTQPGYPDGPAAGPQERAHAA